MGTDETAYGGDPRLLPIYTVGEVAHHLCLASSTVRPWVQAGGGIIVPADGKGARLSFQNLTEVHVMSLLREYNISTRKIRVGIQYLRATHHTEHPLAEVQLKTDRKDLFASLGMLVALTGKHQGQVAIEPVLARYLERIERDESGMLARLYPLVDGDARPVVIDPLRKSGAPYLAALGVETHALASRYRGGDSVEEIAEDYDAPVELIQQALKYERAA